MPTLSGATLNTFSDVMPVGASHRLYSMYTAKGKLKDGTILQCWDPVDECTGKDCPATHKCPYKQTGYRHPSGCVSPGRSFQ